MRGLLAGTAMLLWLVGCAGAAQAPQDDTSAAQSGEAPTCKPECVSPGHCGGWVRVGFDISPSGATENVRVLGSCPPGKFDQAAVAGVSGWKYPAKENGRKNLQVLIDYSPQ